MFKITREQMVDNIPRTTVSAIPVDDMEISCGIGNVALIEGDSVKVTFILG
jgi:hypothetical protein